MLTSPVVFSEVHIQRLRQRCDRPHRAYPKTAIAGNMSPIHFRLRQWLDALNRARRDMLIGGSILMKMQRTLAGLVLSTFVLAACGGAAAPAATAVPAQPAAKPATAKPCTPEAAGKGMPTGKLRLVVATGGTGGVFYPYGGGIARVLGKGIANAEATAEVTGGSVDNMKLINKGDADMGLSTVDSAFDAFNGLGAYADVGPIPGCAIASLYQSFIHVVALESAGITKVEDMKGKRISVGSAGSSTEIAADRMLEAAGLDPKKDIRRDSLSVAESASAMKDQKIDAFFWIGGLPTAAVTDLVTTPNMKVRFVATDNLLPKLKQKYGESYVAATLPKAVYKQEADATGVGVGNLIAVNSKMSEEMAYTLLKGMFDNLADLQASHPEAKKLTLETAAIKTSIPFHPGAIKFFKEKGVWKE